MLAPKFTSPRNQFSWKQKKEATSGTKSRFLFSYFRDSFKTLPLTLKSKAYRRKDSSGRLFDQSF
jgi:hypothetical protein